MIIENSQIASFITQGRKERNISQKQLAVILKRTTSAISQLEKGKVKISASDLSLIADVLNKPIEYFYGENLGGEEIQDFIAVLRKIPDYQKAKTLQTAKMVVMMQEAAEGYRDAVNKNFTDEEMKQFFNDFVDFRKFINDLTEQLNGMWFVLQQSFEAAGLIDKNKNQ
jgi:transcriptional regulator with XRE-family HTH domain